MIRRLRKNFDGVLVVNTGAAEMTTNEQARGILDDDLADAVAVGRQFLANPAGDIPLETVVNVTTARDARPRLRASG